MPDRITIVCPQCSARLSASSEKAGRRLRCPKCSSAVLVPRTTDEQASNDLHSIEPLSLWQTAAADLNRPDATGNPNDGRNTWRPAPQILALTSNHCPACNEALNTLNRDAGFRIACPNCGIELNVPEINRPSKWSSFVFQIRDASSDASSYLFSRKFLGVPMFTSGLFGWFACFDRNNHLDKYCYPLVVVMGIGLYNTVVSRTWWPKLTAAVFGAATVAVLYYSAINDKYNISWVDGSTSYHQEHLRWSGKIVSESIYVYESAEHAASHGPPQFNARGPIAGTGKRHGQWCFTTYLSELPYWDSETVFYWYGERISEGEWHLRNDR